ncbi:UNVERIFIED_CONTAM: hypothetical protein K2H54_053362 [Gekko kuhli]
MACCLATKYCGFRSLPNPLHQHHLGISSKSVPFSLCQSHTVSVQKVSATFPSRPSPPPQWLALVLLNTHWLQHSKLKKITNMAPNSKVKHWKQKHKLVLHPKNG